MGVPAGHPFFGNQFTNGGYIHGTYTYEMINKVIETIRPISEEIIQGATNFATKQKPDNQILKRLCAKGISKNTLIVGSIIIVVTAVGGFITYKLLKREAKAKQDSLQSIELQNVGTCIRCGEPLIGSTYIPEGKEDSHSAYIICKKCGEKNFARYLDEND